MIHYYCNVGTAVYIIVYGLVSVLIGSREITKTLKLRLQTNWRSLHEIETIAKRIDRRDEASDLSFQLHTVFVFFFFCS